MGAAAPGAVGQRCVGEDVDFALVLFAPELEGSAQQAAQVGGAIEGLDGRDGLRGLASPRLEAGNQPQLPCRFGHGHLGPGVQRRDQVGRRPLCLIEITLAAW